MRTPPPFPRPILEDVNKYEMVSKWFETLSDSEKKILTLRFGLDDKEPQTLDTIGRSFGVTRERIRQIEAKSLGEAEKNCGSNRIGSTLQCAPANEMII